MKRNFPQAFCPSSPLPRPPGVGTARLARRLTTIWPAMSLADAIDTTPIHHVAGFTGDRTALVTTRPCRAPHHTISDVGLIGGGQVPRPGDVSLAYHGGLFLRRVSCIENFACVLNMKTFAEFALQVMAVRDSARAR
jgi:predicted ATPase with chaperone activity